MEALILSCSTGGGHNTAAQAVFEALTERGHHAVRMDPYIPSCFVNIFTQLGQMSN